MHDRQHVASYWDGGALPQRETAVLQSRLEQGQGGCSLGLCFRWLESVWRELWLPLPSPEGMKERP